MLKKRVPVRSYTGEQWVTNKTNKKYLAIDFDNRCAYCDDRDGAYGGKASYAVEHFAPKKKFPELKYNYDNLLYACSFCNTSKSSDWPSNSPTINVVGDCGYIDPCSIDYYEHLDRDEETGRIFPKTNLGEYMFNHLKLYLNRHSTLYKMEKLEAKRDELKISIEEDEAIGIDTSKKLKVLKEFDDKFFSYYKKIQDDDTQ